ncbi:hypothetical protein D6855_05010 [Butyrivibrio sp. CB08]|uniref:DUF6796 family protein n=1 Tax=Butyrivibrio sp. CB08 TaxID=2364879 RepID=UPI000EAAB134|nr:DUF6796 family protein [Butyrivibrio sp. CB08]RKM61253.1 hypothetical protein D6855_05010 [Butyrivibrio sp. CB08]
MITTLAIIGIIGGLLCATADLLLDLKGPKNKKLGKMKILDSEWMNMAHWRFVWSDILAMFAVPMYSCGFIALMMVLGKQNQTLATTLTIVFLCGAMGGFMIHTFLCQQPTIYRKIVAKGDEELAEDVIQSTFRQIYVPFFTLYVMLVIIPALVVIVLLITGVLQAPYWCVLLNPLAFQLIGFMFRATKLDIFIDAPSCCAASLGLAAYGVLALICL